MTSPSESAEKDPRSAIIENGWNQGAVIDFTDAVPDFIEASIINSRIRPKHDAKLLIISQDCDILSTEVYIECLLLKKVKCQAPSQKKW